MYDKETETTIVWNNVLIAEGWRATVLVWCVVGAIFLAGMLLGLALK